MPGTQAAHEKTLTATLTAMAGASAIFGLGMLESGITFDFLQAVLDNDIARMVRFAVNGVSTDDEMLALNDIKRVGHTGSFLTSPMTMKYMRGMLSAPDTFERFNRGRWEKKGQRNAEDLARDKLKRIFDITRFTPLSPSVTKEVKRLREEVERVEGVSAQSAHFELTRDYFEF